MLGLSPDNFGATFPPSKINPRGTASKPAWAVLSPFNFRAGFDHGIGDNDLPGVNRLPYPLETQSRSFRLFARRGYSPVVFHLFYNVSADLCPGKFVHHMQCHVNSCGDPAGGKYVW